MDVAHEPPEDILEAMRSAADYDLVAKQYVSGFEIVLHEIVPKLASDCQEYGLISGIVNTHVWLMSRYPDSLIARKLGPEIAEASRFRAQHVVSAGPPGSERYCESLSDLDFWLRSDGNRRNPGTTADLLTAALFVTLLDGTVQVS
jgi:triphosphoribosyl-dephospho-CoA synthase